MYRITHRVSMGVKALSAILISLQKHSSGVFREGLGYLQSVNLNDVLFFSLYLIARIQNDDAK